MLSSSIKPKMMTPPWARCSALSADILKELVHAAEGEEAGIRPINKSIALLRSLGFLADDGRVRPERTAKALMWIASANQSVGRLWEGHINALALIDLYGTPSLQGTLGPMIESGAFSTSMPDRTLGAWLAICLSICGRLPAIHFYSGSQTRRWGRMAIFGGIRMRSDHVSEMSEVLAGQHRLVVLAPHPDDGERFFASFNAIVCQRSRYTTLLR